MAGVIKVDRVQSDSNLAFNIAGANVAFMDASALQMVGSNIAVGGTNVITSGKVVRTGMPVGSVLQVVQTVKTDTFTTTTSGGTFVDITGLSVTITPTSTTNKILVMVDVATGAGGSVAAETRLVRNSTVIYGGDTAGSRSNGLSQAFTGSDYYTWRNGGIYLDSPTTTSATTYKIQLQASAGGTAVYVNRSYSDRDTAGYDLRTASSITVMEIAA